VCDVQDAKVVAQVEEWTEFWHEAAEPKGAPVLLFWRLRKEAQDTAGRAQKVRPHPGPCRNSEAAPASGWKRPKISS
jgi:hypothetical protein